jgi:hypothetical protein
MTEHVHYGDQAEARAVCEHNWAYHCYGGLSVRLCQSCHEPDWDSVRGEREEAERKGALAERERIRQLAIRRGATYPHSLVASGPLAGQGRTAPFADLIAGDGQ